MRVYFIVIVGWLSLSRISGAVPHSLSAPDSLITVEVVTLGNIYPNAAGSLPFTGPGFESAVEDLRHIYGNIFNFSHVYLYNYRYLNCAELATGSDEILGKWYYSPVRQPKKMTVFLFAGKTSSNCEGQKKLSSEKIKIPANQKCILLIPDFRKSTLRARVASWS
jgi:hypothetical protein